MAVIQSILAKVLIQVGADEPKEIGTIEIPIEISTGPKKTGPVYRGANTGHPDDDRAL
ncbi:hypothetical protein QE394_001110 [Arthrobacter sp. SORGH_AS 212]|uniref:hypothetical protein n=1 Tax=Pseudarthrobacter sp. SORGH_AS 212 TaxID=3041777 RepID=UPI002783ADC4|nr:hypothetical protein [Arthrobacter sp. SORGH_AS_0212]